MFASHTYIGGPFVVGSHHLAREMEKLGHSVIHISTPITPFHLLKWRNPEYRERFRILASKKRTKGKTEGHGQGKSEANEVNGANGQITEAKEGLINIVPLSWIPWKLAGSLFKRTGKNWMLPSLKKILAAHNMESIDILFIDQPSFVGLARQIGSKVTIYRPTDLYSKMTGDETVAAAEKTILSEAHALVSTSAPVLSELRPYNMNIPTLLLENGVEYDHFAKRTFLPVEYQSIPSPRAIYIGAIDQRLDLEALSLLAKEMPEVSVVIIGPYKSSDAESFLAFRNVYFLGSKDYKTIPGFLHHSDVALLPLSNHSANKGRSPMKLYEYAAAGLPVVVTETPELLRREETFLTFYQTSKQFPIKVKEALSSPLTKEAIRGMAKPHAWNTKAIELLSFVDSL